MTEFCTGRMWYFSYLNNLTMCWCKLHNRANIIESLFYLLQEVLNPATSFRLSLVPLFWHVVSIFGFSWYLILSSLICKAGFSLYLRFWFSICFLQFSCYLSLWYIILLSRFSWYLHFWFKIRTSEFSWHFAFYIHYLTFHFSHIFLLYTVLQILFYHHISFSLPVFSFLNFLDIFFFEDSNFSATLLTIAPFLMKFLRHSLQWQYSELL